MTGSKRVELQPHEERRVAKLAALFVCQVAARVWDEDAKPRQSAQELRGSRVNRTRSNAALAKRGT